MELSDTFDHHGPGGIAQFFNFNFQGIIVGAYVILFGLFYIFIGSILLSDGVFKIIAGSIVGLIGVAYVVLEFVPQIEPPANMREADGGWGAEQV
ncbi:COPI associated protein [Colletotrichum higginsianum]|nr:COPI associated protein [Colletotrichum higginsianum]